MEYQSWECPKIQHIHPEERKINSTTVHFACCAALFISPTGIIELLVSKNNVIFPDVSCLSFSLATEGSKPRWVVLERKSAEIVRGLQGPWRHRQAVSCPGKGSDLSFHCLPQSHVIWISLTLRLTLKSCSNLTLEWSVTTWLLSTWDMALRFRSVLSVDGRCCPLNFKLQYATFDKVVK